MHLRTVVTYPIWSPPATRCAVISPMLKHPVKIGLYHVILGNIGVMFYIRVILGLHSMYFGVL